MRLSLISLMLFLRFYSLSLLISLLSVTSLSACERFSLEELSEDIFSSYSPYLHTENTLNSGQKVQIERFSFIPSAALYSLSKKNHGKEYWYFCQTDEQCFDSIPDHFKESSTPWFSPKKDGLYASLSRRVPQSNRLATIGTPAVITTSICQVLEKYGLSPQYSWPNDISLNEKKIFGSGSFALSTSKSEECHITSSICLNINTSAKTLSVLDQPATSISIEAKKEIDCEILTEENCVGNGSTAAAVRKERLTGQPVNGRFHTQKAQEGIKKLEEWLSKNPTARPGDRAAAENMIKDLKEALLTPKG